MKTILKAVLILVGLGLAGTVMAEDAIMTPDGYLGFPAFEIGINGNPSSDNWTETYKYTNYTTTGAATGGGNFNYNHLFLDVYYPISRTFTLVGGGSYLINGTGSSSFSSTGSNFAGSENGLYNYSYPSTFSWYLSVKFYTK